MSSLKMNNKLIRSGHSAVLFIGLSLLTNIANAAETASSATVTITGTIVGNTCETAVGENIDFGNLNRTQFVNNIYKKAAKENLITLSNCGSQANEVKVTVTSYGENTAPAAEAAKGVTPVFFDEASELLAMNKSNALTLTSSGSTKSIQLIPALRIDPANFKEGKINSSVSVNIEYQ